MPKVLFLPNSGDDGTAEGEAALNEPPSWLTSAATAFKDGRVKGERRHSARRRRQSLLAAFLSMMSSSPLWASHAARCGGEAKTGAAAAPPSAAKEFIKELVEGTLSEGDGVALPSFPEPTRPRKKADAVLEEFTFESLPLNCQLGGAPSVWWRSTTSRPARVPRTDGKALTRLPQRQGDRLRVRRRCEAERVSRRPCIRAEELPALLAVKGGGGRARRAWMAAARLRTLPR